MNTVCPDWTELVAEREALRDDPPRWHECLRHLDACIDCREQALAADPTLVFRSMGSVEEVATDPLAADVEAMRTAVAAMRRASRIEAARVDGDESSPPESRRRSTRSFAGLYQIAAAFLLAILVLLGGGAERAVPIGTGSLAELEAELEAALGSPVELEPFDPSAWPPALEAFPVDELDLPAPRVYTHVAGDLQVVMVVDSSLEL